MLKLSTVHMYTVYCILCLYSVLGCQYVLQQSSITCKGKLMCVNVIMYYYCEYITLHSYKQNIAQKVFLNFMLKCTFLISVYFNKQHTIDLFHFITCYNSIILFNLTSVYEARKLNSYRILNTHV